MHRLPFGVRQLRDAAELVKFLRLLFVFLAWTAPTSLLTDAKPDAEAPQQGGDATYQPKLPLIAGIIRNVARLQFVQRFPDEIASA